MILVRYVVSFFYMVHDLRFVKGVYYQRCQNCINNGYTLCNVTAKRLDICIADSTKVMSNMLLMTRVLMPDIIKNIVSVSPALFSCYGKHR